MKYLWITLATVLWCVGLNAQAAEAVAKVASVVGDADVVRAEGGETVPLRFRDDVYLNDRIKTDLGSRVKLLLKDSSIVRVGPNSEMRIDKMLVGDGGHHTAIELLKGRLRSVIGKKLGESSSYEVRTNVAVAGVRGTDFETLRLSPRVTGFRTFEGRVAVTNRERGMGMPTFVDPNTFTVVVRGAPPEPPAAIAPGESLESRMRGRFGQSREDRGNGSGGERGRGDDQGEPEGDGGGGEPPADEPAGDDSPASLDAVEGEQLPELPVEEGSREGGLVFEDIDPATRVEQLDGGGSDGATVIETTVLDSASGDEQLNTVTEPPADAVSVPLQIQIPTP